MEEENGLSTLSVCSKGVLNVASINLDRHVHRRWIIRKHRDEGELIRMWAQLSDGLCNDSKRSKRNKIFEKNLRSGDR